MDWHGADTKTGEHIVQFYDAEPRLLDSLQNFLLAGFRAGDRAITIATQAHLQALEDRMRTVGVNLQELRWRGDYLPLNAAETLARFMDGDRPNPAKFFATVGGLARTLSGNAPRRPVRAFGEMVAILWAEGNIEAAIELEGLWNEVIAREAVTLLCAYPMARFRRESERENFQRVCACHSRFVPALAGPA